jgi:phage terminase small subunit
MSLALPIEEEKMAGNSTAMEIGMNGSQPLSNSKQEAFCLEYLLDLNATAAAMRAGYCAKTARQQGARLLSKVDIAARVQFFKAQRVERTEISVDRVVRELAKIAFASVRQMIAVDPNGQPQIDLTNTPHGALDALAEVSTETVLETEGSGKDRKSRPIRKTRIKLHDKIRALQLLGEHTGAFKQGKNDSANAFTDMVNQLLRANPKQSKMPIQRDP